MGKNWENNKNNHQSRNHNIHEKIRGNLKRKKKKKK